MDKRTLGKQIVVLQRGFVYVGDVEIDGQMVTVTNASCIRRWGTDAGLGQLRTGPRPNTKLDPTGTVRTILSAVVHFVEVEADKWQTTS